MTVVSVDYSGAEGNDGSYRSAISRDGRYVAFESDATNLVRGGTNGKRHIYVHDRHAERTTLVSVDSDGIQGNDDSGNPSISAEGRYVAFESESTKLAPPGTHGERHVFVHDRRTGETTLVSVDSSGTPGDSYSGRPSISDDGRYVAFVSYATNLVAGGNNGKYQVYVHDRQTRQTSLISVNSAGLAGNNHAEYPSISAGGRYVAFRSTATDLVPGGTNGKSHIFVYDRQRGQTTRLSVDSAGVEGNNDSSVPSISADGRYVAFESNATNLVAGGTNGKRHIFVRDRKAEQTTLLSVDSEGVEANHDSFEPSISADGRYVAFESEATNLVAGGTNSADQVFVHAQGSGETFLVSANSGGVQGNAASYAPSISADGRYVAFHSTSTNLVVGTTNGRSQIFLHDRRARVYLPLVVR
jgi:Tol biopolymer transport system component